MDRFRRGVLSVTAQPRIPLVLRRRLAKMFIPLDGLPFDIRIDGIDYRGRRDNYIEWLAFATRSFFEYTYLNTIRDLLCGGVALDIGANVGNHTLFFSQIFDRVLAFEPLETVAVRLAEKVADLENVSVHRIALSDREGSMRFAPPTTRNWGQGAIDPRGTLTIPVVRGDTWLETKGNLPVNFIKVDVEGHDLAVLAGLANTIDRDRPVVMFELPTALRHDPNRNLCEAYRSFPDDYHFVGFRTQSSFPLQVDQARVVALTRDRPRMFGKITNILAFGGERGFEQVGNRLSGPTVR